MKHTEKKILKNTMNRALAGYEAISSDLTYI